MLSVEDMETLAKGSADNRHTIQLEKEEFTVIWAGDISYFQISGYSIPRTQFDMLLDFARNGDERSPGFTEKPKALTHQPVTA